MILRALDPAAAVEHRHEILADATEIDVGRSPECGVVLAAKSVSRVHARFRRSGTEWTLEDLGSSNGTAVNGTPVHAPVPVRPGDRVRFGSLEFLLEAPPAAESESETLLAPPDRAAPVAAAPAPAGVELPKAATGPAVAPAPAATPPRQRERTAPATSPSPTPSPSEPAAPARATPPLELALIAAGTYVLVVAGGLLVRWLLG